MKCNACGSATMIKRLLYIGAKDVRAYACVHCHNLQFGVDFKETDFERYQQFEGEQPDVLERINSSPKKLDD